MASTEQTALQIRLLGGFQVAVGSRVIAEGEWRLRKVKGLVKLLALAPGHRLHREQVMDALWPDLGSEAASNNLRKALHVARRALGSIFPAASQYLQSQDDLLALRAPGLWIDVEAFQAAAADARWRGDLAAYKQAVELYGGDLLPEDRYEDWTIERREELRGVFMALLGYPRVKNYDGSWTEWGNLAAAPVEKP